MGDTKQKLAPLPIVDGVVSFSGKRLFFEYSEDETHRNTFARRICVGDSLLVFYIGVCLPLRERLYSVMQRHISRYSPINDQHDEASQK